MLLRQGQQTIALLQEFGELSGNVTYAPGKWTVKQVLGHLADDERIFAYRALCVARGDSRPLPGFDENDYATAARFENRSLADLLADFEAVRHASITLFRGLDKEARQRRGIVNGYSASPRGLTFHIAPATSCTTCASFVIAICRWWVDSAESQAKLATATLLGFAKLRRCSLILSISYNVSAVK